MAAKRAMPDIAYSTTQAVDVKPVHLIVDHDFARFQLAGTVATGGADFTPTSSRSTKRDAAPGKGKPIKNATRAAVDVRTRATCRSKGSSGGRIRAPSQ